ncbi:MAG: OmpA family protein [Candidatus Accumulibacter phosphatis]|jgi:OOP family OmpA-OmpF porin|uniref:Inner membrane lipoprotein YiaD n=3 Tax=Candidatus Accumulibacter TaxID=327159 RepID=A0A080MB69_9PROT|nr:OmpA family protein [Accumulibacter sp.]KFB74399.1 MAG: Inner membrane lipoprotein YiaD precursor [Candidatus Accumulibacter phosphatis]MBL8406254.1 OmpA family protein [Accumulibacter sp.]NMQ03955.1 OmpA family protein [Candidatus Accumulibacter contiguus]HRF13934.1 OmpA family protein [Candidatus Accumulibacter phosphatis]
MKYVRLMGFLFCALAPMVSYAQGEYVLRPEEINERALIDMLAPETAARPARPKSRSINVMREESSPTASKPAAASLLIIFETNSATLTPKGKQSLDVVGRALNSEKLVPFSFTIEGHSDPRGGDELNLKLSQARAESVVGYLSDSHQVERSRLKPVGKGPTELLNPARPDAPENRRVTIKRLDK